MVGSPPPSVALLLHGKIGLWSIKSANVPKHGTMPNLKTNDKYLADAVARPPSITGVRASNTTLWELERRPHSMLLGFARFASKSILQRIIEPNRRAGVKLDVFLHSWHPEIGADLDHWYSPVSSRHDQPVQLQKVASHHLSMKRGLALIAAHTRATDGGGTYRPANHPPPELVMVARFDLIFFTDFLFTPLLSGPPAPLWLPTWCMRYPVNGEQFEAMTGACGGRNRGTAYIMTPPRVSVMHTRLRRVVSPTADVDMAMLDWWFVAPLAIAASFGDVHDQFSYYASLLRRLYPYLPHESHYFWALHVYHVLKVGGALRYIPEQLEGRDFRLARQWMYGSHCSSSLRRAFPTTSPAELSQRLALNLTLWRRTDDALAQQCRFDENVHLFCPWASPVCPNSLKRAALDIEAEAKAAFAETTRIRPLPKLWLAARERQAFRVAGLTVGARRNFSRQRAGG